MKRLSSLQIIAGIGCLIIAVLIYMFAILKIGNKQEVIYFVSKTSSENSTFWRSVERGVKVATDELGIELVFVGPEREIDFEEQVKLVEEGIELKPTAIILAASDFTYLSEVSKKVISKKIPFLTLDSDVDIVEEHSFIATNNIKAAKLLGEEMARLIGEKGLVGIISHLEGTTSAIDRAEGFAQAINAYENMELIQEVPYSNNDSKEAYIKTIQFIQKYPKVKGIFGTNEATLIGIAQAVDELNLKDQITLVGFDISEVAAGYLENDTIKAIIVQRPFNMGYLSVKEAYKQAKSGKSPERIDVNIVFVNKENMFEEENQKFIIPFLE